MRVSVQVILFGSLLAVSAAAAVPGDARRGEQLFESQKCIACHSLKGRGGRMAPDLAKTIDRAWTPGLLASLMWNHAPAMWPAMEKAGIPRPQMSEQQAADLYAYLYAFRFFEKPGDAARGKRAFAEKNCAVCHSISANAPQGPGPSVLTWTSLTDSIALARAMWNHSARMRDEMRSRKLAWPVLTSQDLTDLVVYLRNIPGMPPAQEQFAPGTPQSGEALFQSRGCSGCHQGSLSMQGRFRGRTLTDLAAAMWNHSPKMMQMGLTTEEMRNVVGYLWSLQYFDDPGDAQRGKKVFTNKRCAACHNTSSGGAPALVGRNLDSIGMVSVLWQHGPNMLARMRERKIAWPVFRGSELNDLIAYVNSLK